MKNVSFFLCLVQIYEKCLYFCFFTNFSKPFMIFEKFKNIQLPTRKIGLTPKAIETLGLLHKVQTR